MSLIRLHVADALAQGATLTLGEAQARYLAAVMRRSVGDAVLVFNGRDGEWQAAIATLAKGRATLAIGHRTRAQTSSPDLWLLAPVLKRETLEWMVEKATELGAARILAVTTERSAVTRTNPERLTAIAAEAAEQCERLDVPVVDAPQPLATVLAGWNPDRRLVVGDERGRSPPIADAIAGEAPGPWAVLVGPEGGFTARELDGLRKLPFCRLASLGPRILRAETAALSALAVLQALAGDWRDHHLA
ncbi:16S rRNA (uracil(1498)-N(3))-methyltransferase [Elioraea sp.]|uniref:16S rRNA (uracil(1498)-N(3))-methyltransferase n=1 Tax=Elioraea sp. TaxID=2185103 RepID=UPI0025BED1A8|nr:16S rRNA (uracil(1498)-N(3))-methyltransferase [Elioraea sp.]